MHFSLMMICFYSTFHWFNGCSFTFFNASSTSLNSLKMSSKWSKLFWFSSILRKNVFSVLWLCLNPTIHNGCDSFTWMRVLTWLYKNGTDVLQRIWLDVISSFQITDLLTKTKHVLGIFIDIYLLLV